MTRNELYEILNAPRRTKRNIAVKKVEMEKLRVMMLPGAIRYDTDSVQSSPKDPMLVFAEKMDVLNTQLRALEGLYMQQYEEVEHLISKLDDKYKGVLTLKYLGNCKPEEIANELSYAESYVYKLKKEAIKILERG